MRWAVLALLFSLSSHAQVVVRDDYGNQVRLPSPASRIVSLAPHLTELLYAAGAGARAVGAVDYSDNPAEARALPRELEDIASTLERLGSLAGTPGEAARAAAEFRARKAGLEARYAKRAPLRVFYMVWDRPLLTVNGQHVISKVIRLCGGENVFAALPAIAPEVEPEAVLRANPDVILTSRPAVQGLLPGLDRSRFQHIPAELIQRHTPRLLDGAELVCRALERARAARS